MLIFQFRASSDQTSPMDNINRITRPTFSVLPRSLPLILSLIISLSFVVTFIISTCVSLSLSTIVYRTIFLVLYLICMFILWSFHDRLLWDTDMGTQQNNLRVLEIGGGIFWVLGERQGLRKTDSEKLLGPVVCFGSQEMAPSSCSDCAICLEDFQKGEECLAFPICSHLYHSKCIKHWLQKKLSCPVCRFGLRL